eukprot:TRINITY_DN18100_c0_g1_i2.p1 TRINITY_DN18100_c0_g1~~TRINITY_DN18100_c0_g1_i2.p1  ORF type:complete len:222 (+),score=41.26 TRINITY_DN18100_c0_g1_i2:104-769(+)
MLRSLVGSEMCIRDSRVAQACRYKLKDQRVGAVRVLCLVLCQWRRKACCLKRLGIERWSRSALGSHDGMVELAIQSSQFCANVIEERNLQLEARLIELATELESARDEASIACGVIEVLQAELSQAELTQPRQEFQLSDPAVSPKLREASELDRSLMQGLGQVQSLAASMVSLSAMPTEAQLKEAGIRMSPDRVQDPEALGTQLERLTAQPEASDHDQWTS